MELALGTVQFGLRYGIAGRGEAVPHAEARRILERAADLGIRLLDTAAAYGDIEQRLGALIEGLPFGVVSKLPARPAHDGQPETPEALARWAADMVERSASRLGGHLKALLFHRAEDLVDAGADALWVAAAASAARHGIALGVSGYSPSLVQQVARERPITVVQLPGNAFDQALAAWPASTRGGIDVHVRSAFLQGLLLMTPAAAAQRLPAAAPALERWQRWCAERALPPLAAALGIVKGLGGSHCVVGVDNLAQLESIVGAWHAAPALSAPELALTDPSVTDPRTWSLAPA